jgi:hypothetical protein
VIIAFKTWGSMSTASTRLRAILPMRQLNLAGIKAELFDSTQPHRYAAVVFQKAYAPEDIALARSLKQQNIKVFFDLCDNHFYNPKGDPSLAERAERLKTMISLADHLVVSSPLLGELAGRSFTVIDDLVEKSVVTTIANRIIRPAFKVIPRKVIRLVWFGSAGTEDPRFGLVDLSDIIQSLNELNKSLKIHLTVISNSHEKFLKYTAGAAFPKSYFTWRLASFPGIMAIQDICLIPIDVNPFTACKTNNRPLLSLSLGVPVIATKIPSYESLSKFMLFENWRENIYTYASNPAIVQDHLREGNCYINEHFSLKRITQQWIELFENHI